MQKRPRGKGKHGHQLVFRCLGRIAGSSGDGFTVGWAPAAITPAPSVAANTSCAAWGMRKNLPASKQHRGAHELALLERSQVESCQLVKMVMAGTTTRGQHRCTVADPVFSQRAASFPRFRVVIRRQRRVPDLWGGEPVDPGRRKAGEARRLQKPRGLLHSGRPLRGRESRT